MSGSSFHIVLVDEAGQIGGKQMWELLRFIKENHGRVILSGDTRQHGAVEATDALRAIEKYSGLQYAELTTIRRQNPDTAKTRSERRWLEQYRLAVSEAREGKLAQSFDRLDKQNAIVACTLADQQQKLADQFLELSETGHSMRSLAKNYRQFGRGYAVTSYAAQGQNVDYVLFSDSGIKAATNHQQWYVTISRGRKGIKIFTPDKIQLRQNIAHSGDRPLALDIAKPTRSFAHTLAKVWRRNVAYVLNVRCSHRKAAQRQAEIIRESETVQHSQTVRPRQTARQTKTIAHKHHKQNQTNNIGGGIRI
jgi:hypothetical protein